MPNAPAPRPSPFRLATDLASIAEYAGPERRAILEASASALILLAEAVRPLANIFEAWKNDGLDEDRPDWRARNVGEVRPFKDVELFSGRGGKQLLTLADAQRAWQVLPLSAQPDAIPPAETDPPATKRAPTFAAVRSAIVAVNDEARIKEGRVASTSEIAAALEERFDFELSTSIKIAGKLSNIELALRQAFPHFQGGEVIDAATIKAIGDDYLKMVQGWGPVLSEISFIDQDGKPRKVAFVADDDGESWLIAPDENWEVADRTEQAPDADPRPFRFLDRGAFVKYSVEILNRFLTADFANVANGRARLAERIFDSVLGPIEPAIPMGAELFAAIWAVLEGPPEDNVTMDRAASWDAAARRKLLKLMPGPGKFPANYALAPTRCNCDASCGENRGHDKGSPGCRYYAPPGSRLCPRYDAVFAAPCDACNCGFEGRVK